MSDDDQPLLRTGTASSGSGSGSGDTLLTPEACAIAGFTLAALTMTGQGAWTAVAQSLFGSSFPESSLGTVLASGFLAALVVDVLAVLLARRALADPGSRAGWAGHLARAAIVVAVLGAGFSLLALVISVVLGVH